MQIAQLFFHNSILIASRTTDFWCFLKELAGLNRILIGFCDLLRQILLIREKTASIIQKTAQKNRQHDSFACLFGDVWAVKGFFYASFCDTSESEMPTLHNCDWKAKISKHHPENGIKTGSTILSPACLGIFEPSKALSMLLFMMPANQTASRCNQNQNANDQRRHLPVAFP